MTLFSLVKKNIRGNLKSYSLYFITMIISIVMYDIFVSLQNSREIKEVLEHSGAMQSTFMMSSVVLILFAGIFILYSNSFFTRKRKKEVGLYAIIGVPKRTIGRMLFYENLIMGMAALLIGIFFGTLLSRLFTMILIKLIGTSVNIGLGLSFSGIMNTFLVFLIIILITSLQGYRLIYKFKLIELFKAENKGEEKPKASALIAAASALLLIGSYVLAKQALPRGNTTILMHTCLIIFGMAGGSYFFFHSFVVFLLVLLQKNKKYLYRGTNMIGTSQLLYRIKGNVRVFTAIALLSSLTISFLGSIFAQYESFEGASRSFAPFSYTHLSKGKEYDDKIASLISADKEHPLIAQTYLPIIEVPMDFTIPKNYESDFARVISLSTFRSVAQILYPDIDLEIGENEMVAIRPAFTKHTSSDYRGKAITLKTSKKEVTFRFIGMVEERVLTWDYPDFFVIVSDSAFKELEEDIPPYIFKAYEVENEADAKSTSDQLMALNPGEANVFNGQKDNTMIFSYYMVYQENLEKSALNLFVIGFLGLIFLAATGSILYFKQLTEATESRPNFAILRKIGVTRKEIAITVAKQNLTIFALPLLLGMIDSIILLSFLTKFLSDLIGIDFGGMLLLSNASFIVIYLGYYLLTVRSYIKIVNDPM